MAVDIVLAAVLVLSVAWAFGLAFMWLAGVWTKTEEEK